MVEALGFRSDERVLQTGSPSFDISVLQVLGPLMAGATSVIAPDAVRVPGDELVEYIERHGVTVVNLLPSFLAAMPDHAEVDPSVIFMVGAERLDPELADRWGRVPPRTVQLLRAHRGDHQLGHLEVRAR